MIELERHIEILLLDNDCVIVPDLGGFMAHRVDARYDESEGTFLPPLRTLGFNPQLKMNDSLLVQSYIEAYDISYPEALRRIESEVAELRQHLETEGEYDLCDIGLLRLNGEGALEFEPCEAGILTPQLYGLSTFEMKLLEQDTPKAEEEPTASAAIDEKAMGSANERTITIKMSWLRNVAAVAAAILAFFMINDPVSNSQVEVQQSSFIPIHSKPTATVATPTPQPTNETAKEQAHEVDVFCLVLASQVGQRNANAFVDQLRSEGFEDAATLQSKSMLRVVYGSYATESEAYQSLRTLRAKSKHFTEAWVMKK